MRRILGLLLLMSFVMPLFCEAQLLKKKARSGSDDEPEIELPEERPNPSKDYLDKFKENKRYTKFFDLRDEVEQLLVEKKGVIADTEPGKEAKSQRKIEDLENKVRKARRKFYKEAEKIRDPWQKEYDQLNDKYETMRKKADAMTESGNDKGAEKLMQDAQKFTGKLEGHKRNLDLINYFIFLDNDDQEAPEGKKAELKDKDKDKGKDKDKDEDGDGDKGKKKRKGKRAKKDND